MRVDYDLGVGEHEFQGGTSDQPEQGRDAVDFITTAGWAWRATKALAVGVEGLAQDLEGFWDPQQAEGGARILIGPSPHVASAGRRWQLTTTGGPIFHPARRSGQPRDSRPAFGHRPRRLAVRAGVTFRPF